MRVLVLGHTGMLGHMVVKYLMSQQVQVTTTDMRWPFDKLNTDVDYVVNCIGAIHQRTHDFKINVSLPVWLSENSTAQVIHPGTDCEMDNDAYGRSKKIASEYIKLFSTNTKILKTSIIGPERNSSYSLLNWFLSQHQPVQGYTMAIWNGNTTLEWAKQAYLLMNNWANYETETIISTDVISKYDLLHTIKEVYNKDIDIIPIPRGQNKALLNGIYTKPIKQQLIELRDFNSY